MTVIAANADATTARIVGSIQADSSGANNATIAGPTTANNNSAITKGWKVKGS
jgi:hypothetical protein